MRRNSLPSRLRGPQRQPIYTQDVSGRRRRTRNVLQKRHTYEDAMKDLRFALRQLRYAPAFTVTALATIAICLGANLAIFAVIDAILLRSLPFPQSDRLVAIFNTYPKAGRVRSTAAPRFY